MQTPEKQHHCFGCSQTVVEPYIRCTECVPPFCYLCLACYATGKEFGLHENGHSYQVFQSNFPIFSKNWTASQELKLLEAIEKFGLGNWESIARWVPSKTAEDCKLHYFNHYIYNPHPDLPRPEEPTLCVDNWSAPVPFKNCSAPPRPSLTSYRFNELAGYMPARGDFVFERDDFTEMGIKDVDFENASDDITFALMFAAVEIFRSKLRERIWCKNIMRRYGLINPSDSFLMSTRYSDTVSKTNIAEKLTRFAKLLSAEDLYKFLEGLHLECKLKLKINNLKEYRQAGISNFYSVPLYKKLRHQKIEANIMKRNAFTEALGHVSDERSMKMWLSKSALKNVLKPVDDVSKLAVGRKPAARLDIVGVPGYEQLNNMERELCSLLRLVPYRFIHFKTILINEYQRCGVLKLGQARSLVKIDVNKTRKIYNYLIESEQIKKD